MLSRNRTLRLAVCSFAGVLGVLVLFIALLHTPPVREYALKQIVEILGKRGIVLSTGGVEYNLLAGSAALNAVEVRSAQAPDLPPILTADRLEIQLSVAQALRGETEIFSAVIRNPVVHFAVDDKGRDNLPHSSDTSNSTTDYLIHHALLTGGSVRYEDRRQKLDATLPLDRITVAGNPSNHHHAVTLRTKPGVVLFEQRTMPLRNVAANFTIEKEALNVGELRIGLGEGAGESTILASGRLNNFNDPRFDFKADTTLALSPTLTLAGVARPVSGNVHVALAANGPLPKLHVDVKLDGNDIAVEEFKQLKVNAEASYDAAASRIEFGSFQIVSPQGTVQGKASVALNGKAGQSTAQLGARGLDLKQLSSKFALPVQIASTATAEVMARWPALEFEKANGAATVRLAAKGTPARGLIPVSGTLQANGGRNQLIVDVASLDAWNSTTSGRVTLSGQTKIGGQLKTSATDLAPTVAALEAYLGEKAGTLIGTPLSGAATASTELSGTLRNMQAAIQLDAPSLQAGELSGISVQSKVTYSPDRLRFEETSLRWQEQSASLAGTMELRGAAPTLDLTADTQSLSIAALLAGFNHKEIPATGAVEFHGRMTGPIKDPQIQATLAGRDLIAYGETFGTLQSEAVLRNGVWTLQSARLDKPQAGGDGVIQANGTFAWQTKRYTVEASGKGLRLTNLTLPNGIPLRGALTFDGNGQGTVDDPAVQLKLDATGARYGETDLGAVTLAVNAANHRATVEAAAPKYSLTGKAEAATAAPYAGTFEIRAAKTDLASLPVEFAAIKNGELKGTVTGVISGAANFANFQETASAAANLDALALTWNNQPIRSAGPLVARYQNQMLTLDQVSLVAGDSKATLQGTIPLDDTKSGDLRLTAQLNLEQLNTYIPASKGISTSGTAVVNGSVRGNFKRLDPEVTIDVTNGMFAKAGFNPPLHDANIHALIRNGAVELQSAKASWGPSPITASGVIPLAMFTAGMSVEFPKREGPAQFTAEIQDVDLATIEGLPQQLAGSVTARLEATAARPDLASLQGTLTFPTLRLAAGTYVLTQTAPSRIAIQNGIARVENFTLTGDASKVQVTGSANLLEPRTVDLRLDGTLDAVIVRAFTDAVNARGVTTLQLAVQGPLAEPKASGFLELTNAQISIANPRIAADRLNARVELAGNQAQLTRLNGTLNGGTLSGSGSIGYAKGDVRDANLNLKVDNMYLDFPEGLRTMSNATLTLRSQRDQLVLGGEVLIVEGGFTDNLNFDRGILAAIGKQNAVDITAARNPLRERTHFNVAIRTENPLIVNNNLAKTEVAVDVRLTGTAYEPGLSGRLTIEEGGTITLNERKYTLDRGIVTFTNDRRIEPTLDLTATTRASNYDITLKITGEPGKTETTLTSDPALPEPDILSILLTGGTLNDLRGREVEVARNEVLSYLTGRVGSTIGRGIEGATGLSMVRIEPNLIASETDPSARLTVGQNITRALQLIYSMDLVNSSDQIFVAQYDISKRFTTTGVRQADGSARFDFKHDIRFGGIPEPARQKRVERRIGTISFDGLTFVPEKQAKSKLGVKSGSVFDFFKVRKGVDRLTNLYTKANYLESAIHLHREQQQDSTVNLSIDVEEGPQVVLAFEGATPPNSVRNQVRDIWKNGVFDTQRTQDAVDVLSTWLVKEGRLRPQIKFEISTPAPDRKRVVFDIQQGPVFHDVELVFEGASQVAPATLQRVIDNQKLSTDVYIKPARVAELLSRYYREQGLLDSEVSAPRYELNTQTATGKVVFPIKEGPLYRIGKVQFHGNTAYDDARLRAAAPLPAGEPFRPILREHAIDRLRSLYWDVAYNDVEVQSAVERHPEQSTVDLTFEIAENRQSVVGEITVEGNDKTSESMIRTQLEVKSGDVLSLQSLSKSRRNLYNTGAYSIVEVNREEVPPPEQAADVAATAEAANKLVNLHVKVREIQPYQLRYGGFYDSERGPGGIADIENRNSLGSARVIGLRTRYDSQLREARLYFSQPLLRRFPLKTIVSPYIRQERNPATASTDPFNVDRVGFSVQQEARLFERYVLNYGYKIERSRTFDPGPEPLFDVSLRIASLTSTINRDTRDDILDATKGSFFSQAFQWSPETLGSQLRLVKYFGQYFRYFPLQKPRVELFTNRELRPRLVYAAGARVGLATGLGGQEIPLSERFFTGGSTSMRGSAQNSVGPVGFERMPRGGNAMILINNEIRFPLFWIVDGVGFVDMGNVYPKVSDFHITDIRKDAGAGIRLRTPWFLVRLDYGVKLDRRTGESFGRFFFSIGQAF